MLFNASFQVKESFHAFTTGLRSLKVELVQSNKVFVRNGYALTNEIINDLRTNFDTEIQNVDLAKISDAADKINLWVCYQFYTFHIYLYKFSYKYPTPLGSLRWFVAPVGKRLVTRR